jgi:aspartate/methionine/tyrosine aminotransferase
MFSSRVPAHLESNAITRAVERARSAGRELIDLTLTNPTRAGIAYPDTQLQALSAPDAAIYTPECFGLPSARGAVSGDYARRGIVVSPDRVVLTSSTSEAYSLLFKLLCEPSGDSVMAPVPSYPLFEHLTHLDGVRTIPYRLEYHTRWDVDLADLDQNWQEHTRAVLAVSPNNPTGSVLTAEELRALDSRCAVRACALIIDEVFADYPLDAAHGPIVNGPTSDALVFRLGGLSKSAALPQVKLGWIAVDGPETLVSEALERLSVICDTYLSVSTPVQTAASHLIAEGVVAREQVLHRVRANYAALGAMIGPRAAVDLLHVEAGWSAVLRVPSRGSEEDIVLQLLEDGVLVHPGFFFDFSHEAYLVISLLPLPDEFTEGVRRLLECVDD